MIWGFGLIYDFFFFPQSLCLVVISIINSEFWLAITRRCKLGVILTMLIFFLFFGYGACYFIVLRVVYNIIVNSIHKKI